MTTKKLPQLKVPGVTAIGNFGTPFAVYERGVSAYDRLRPNGEVELVLDDGTTKTATVQQLQVGPLIDLVTGYGSQAVHTAGRIYSPLALVQALTDASTEGVLDVTKLYTVIVVQLPIEPMPTGVIQTA